jgi:hypothetical protein
MEVLLQPKVLLLRLSSSSSSRIIIWEAPSGDDAYRFVHGMQWLISRLVFHLVMGDTSGDDAYRFVHGMQWLISRLVFHLVMGDIDGSCELLDLGRLQTSSPSLREFDWSRAMDDVTDQLLVKRNIVISHN